MYTSRVADFHQRVVASIPCLPDDAEIRAELAAKPLEDVIAIYLNYYGRFVPPRPRRVHYAPSFWTEPALTIGGQVTALAGKIERGEDLSPYLSPNIGQNGFVRDGSNRRWEHERDFALNAFGVHHLHLVPRKSKQLLFVGFSRADAVLVMLGDHKSFDNGTLAEAVSRYQAEAGGEVKGVQPSGPGRSPKEQVELARHCINSFGTFGDKVTFGTFLASNGDSVRGRRLADYMTDRVEKLDPHLDDRPTAEAMLRSATVPLDDTLDFAWDLNDTDLVLFEQNSRILGLVAPGYC